jgi:hypothetical protein
MRLEGELPFETTVQWYDYQEKFVNSLDVTAMTEVPLYRDRAAVARVIVYKRKEPLRKNAEIALYGDRIVVDSSWSLPFSEVTAVTVLGRNKLNIYHGSEIYQLKGGKRLCALKYVHIFNRCKNIMRGEENDQFLGL